MANPGERSMCASCNQDSVIVELPDVRTISAPLAWYPRPIIYTPEELLTNDTVSP
jgi:hypothetical protein